MSSTSISSARNQYGGNTERETLMNMAQTTGCYRIYKYANAYGDRVTPTDYKRISQASDEQALLSSSNVYNVVLVYDQGKLLNLDDDNITEITERITKKWWEFWK